MKYLEQFFVGSLKNSQCIVCGNYTPLQDEIGQFVPVGNSRLSGRHQRHDRFFTQKDEPQTAKESRVAASIPPLNGFCTFAEPIPEAKNKHPRTRETPAELDMSPTSTPNRSRHSESFANEFPELPIIDLRSHCCGVFTLGGVADA
jgi:hypothetical protein